MGGLRKLMPWTFYTFLIASLGRTRGSSHSPDSGRKTNQYRAWASSVFPQIGDCAQ